MYIKLFKFSLVILLLTSCTVKEVQTTIEIYYQDGSTEQVTIKDNVVVGSEAKNAHNDIYFHDGCLYTEHRETKYDANYQGCIRCGVKSYRIVSETSKIIR